MLLSMTDLQIIAPLIHIIRGHRVILDSDLAKLYGVPTMRLNEACVRNIARFPDDFRFQLNNQEFASLISQIAISKGRGGKRKLPYAFTEHGATMAATLLRSPEAIDISIKVVRAFVSLRQMVANFSELEKKVEKMEEKYDEEFAHVFETLRQLILPPPEKKNRIGFIINKK